MSAEAYIAAYIAVGLIVGVVTLKLPGCRSEGPVGTLLVIVAAWPILAALLLLTIPFLILGGFLSLIGVEAHQSDTRGV